MHKCANLLVELIGHLLTHFEHYCACASWGVAVSSFNLWWGPHTGDSETHKP